MRPTRRLPSIITVAALAVACSCGCATKALWRWAGESRYEVTPSQAECPGVEVTPETTDTDTRLWFVVLRGYAGEREMWFLDVPPTWQGLELTPPGGERRLVSLLPFEPAGTTPVPTRYKEESVVAVADPLVDDAPDSGYGWHMNRDGILSVYAPHERMSGWVRLAELPTAQTVEISPSPFEYVMATTATPITAAVDVVGIAGYLVLWPLWASLGIGYESSPDDRPLSAPR